MKPACFCSLIVGSLPRPHPYSITPPSNDRTGGPKRPPALSAPSLLPPPQLHFLEKVERSEPALQQGLQEEPVERRWSGLGRGCHHAAQGLKTVGELGWESGRKAAGSALVLVGGTSGQRGDPAEVNKSQKGGVREQSRQSAKREDSHRAAQEGGKETRSRDRGQ